MKQQSTFFAIPKIFAICCRVLQVINYFSPSLSLFFSLILFSSLFLSSLYSSSFLYSYSLPYFPTFLSLYLSLFLFSSQFLSYSFSLLFSIPIKKTIPCLQNINPLIFSLAFKHREEMYHSLLHYSSFDELYLPLFLSLSFFKGR